MGTLVYAGSREIEMDDYTLAHIKVVILAKLRLGQAFPFNFPHPARDGRTTLWISAAVPMEFKFDTEERPEPDRAWIESLLRSANSTEGMHITPRP